MQLQVRPADLHEAAASLARVAAGLRDAGSAFAAVATATIPEIGRDAVPAATDAAAATRRAEHVVAEDVDRLAQALRLLAHFYAQADTTAVPPRAAR